MQELRALIKQGCIRGLHEQWFSSIADELLKNTHVISNGTCYRFKEIEFYYYDSEHHPDTTTYGYMSERFKKDNLRVHRHKQKQYETFTWFIHYSGIDIVFGNKKNPGGILIRSIERIDEQQPPELIKGPLVVMLELLNQSVNVFDGNRFELKLVASDENTGGIVIKKSRKGLGKSDFVDYEYNFSI